MNYRIKWTSTTLPTDMCRRRGHQEHRMKSTFENQLGSRICQRFHNLHGILRGDSRDSGGSKNNEKRDSNQMCLLIGNCLYAIPSERCGWQEYSLVKSLLVLVIQTDIFNSFNLRVLAISLMLIASIGRAHNKLLPYKERKRLVRMAASLLRNE
jgi:hypothetical protein